MQAAAKLAPRLKLYCRDCPANVDLDAANPGPLPYLWVEAEDPTTNVRHKSARWGYCPKHSAGHPGADEANEANED
jgi:hypothetical protein